jgi:hypothetical protein
MRGQIPKFAPLHLGHRAAKSLPTAVAPRAHLRYPNGGF